MSSPKNLSYRSKMARRHQSDKRQVASHALEIRMLKAKLEKMGRDLDRAELRIAKLGKGLVA